MVKEELTVDSNSHGNVLDDFLTILKEDNFSAKYA